MQEAGKTCQKAYAKINLGLDVEGRLENGYHLVKMIMQTLSLHDVVTVAKSDQPGIRVFVEGSDLPGDRSNLAYQAAEVMQEAFSISEGIDVWLEKNIPMAAGLAGGSSDAAAVLRGINELFQLGASQEKLRELGVGLGADVPFCVVGGSQLSEGIGEKLTRTALLPSCHVLLAKPEASVSTKWVYEEFDSLSHVEHPDVDGVKRALEAGDLKGVCGLLGNVLEGVTVKAHPVIQELKELMVEQGAMASLMSGSGPTVFGIFEEEEKLQACAHEIMERGLAVSVHACVPVGEYR